MMTIFPYASYIAYPSSAAAKPKFGEEDPTLTKATILYKEYIVPGYSSRKGFHNDGRSYFALPASGEKSPAEKEVEEAFLNDASPDRLREIARREGIPEQTRVLLGEIAASRDQQNAESIALLALLLRM